MTNPQKARWAADKARQLDQQVMALEAERGGDWRARQRRRDGATRLRREADRYRGMAARWAA